MRLRQLATLLTLVAVLGSTGCTCCHKHGAPAPAACPQGCPPPGGPVGGAVVPGPPAPVTGGYYSPPVSAVSAPAFSSTHAIDYRP
jgi:hypothetical protein